MEQEKAALLHLAREAIVWNLRGRSAEAPSLPPDVVLRAPSLQECRGAFVSLHRGPELRGCMGTFEREAGIADIVREMAVAAASRDPRFDPVVEDEVEDLSIEISLLGPLVTATPEDVRVGVHGLAVRQGPRRGVLLPQVAVEHHWTREEFLAHTCVKAGLPPNAWLDGETKIEAFTAEVFRDRS